MKMNVLLNPGSVKMADVLTLSAATRVNATLGSNLTLLRLNASTTGKGFVSLTFSTRCVRCHPGLSHLSADLSVVVMEVRDGETSVNSVLCLIPAAIRDSVRMERAILQTEQILMNVKSFLMFV